MGMLANLMALALTLTLIGGDEPRPPANVPGLTIAFTPSRKDGVVVDGPGSSKAPTALGPVTLRPSEAWHLSLPDAIRIGLSRSEILRVIAQGSPKLSSEPGVVIARLDADGSLWDFQESVMAQVRSIEQCYWALGHQQTTLGSRETACRIGGEILARQRAERVAGRGTQADVVEAEQQLENFQFDLVCATSDLESAEEQLRSVLGLPLADDRRIVPSTAPIEAKVEPDWETSVRSMTESQPDIAQQTVLVRVAELRLLLARNLLLPLMTPESLGAFRDLGRSLVGDQMGFGTAIRQYATRPLPRGLEPTEFREPVFVEQQAGLAAFPTVPSFRSRLANARQSQYRLLQERAAWRRIVDQATRSLARSFREIDANYKRFETARRLREVAQERLESRTAIHEEGRIGVDSLLDAVIRHANAISQESLCQSRYHTSIASFEEAKGTLLEFHKVTILKGPIPEVQGRTADNVVLSAFEAPVKPAIAATFQAKVAPISYKIKAKFGGSTLLEVEVEVGLGSIR